jgi:mono/diheme cytochrome c family protein
MLFARRYRLPALCLAALLLVLVIPAALPAAAAPTLQDTPAGPPDPQAGRESYAQNCAPCHGETGAGDGPSASSLDFPPTALGDAAAISDLSPQDWFDVTKNGRIERMMPPWSRRLTDQQIWDTVGYAWSLHTSRAQVDMGKAVYEQNCATCHGPDGVGTPPMLDFTDFAATSPISQAAWADVTANGRDKMPAFADELSEAEQTAVLEYVRSLSMGPMFGAPLAPGSGIITGTITNATTGAPVANASVTLTSHSVFGGTLR